MSRKLVEKKIKQKNKLNLILNKFLKPKMPNFIKNVANFANVFKKKIISFFSIKSSNFNVSNLSENDFLLIENHIKSSKKFRKRFLSITAIVILSLCCFKKIENTDQAYFLPDYNGVSSYVANITIDGVIDKDYYLYDSLKKIKDNKSIKAVILSVNSPGGSVEPSERIYNLLKQISEKKPLVVCMETVAASGGYMISTAGKRIFAMKSTITGSIGVFSQSFEITELANKLGVSATYIKTSPIKGSPNLFEKPSQEVIDMEKNLVTKMHDLFKSIVSKERGIDGELLEFVSNGQVFTGEMAVENRLVDEIGDEDSAMNWLKSQNLIDKDLEMKYIFVRKPEKNGDFFIKSMISSSISAFHDFYSNSKSDKFSFLY